MTFNHSNQIRLRRELRKNLTAPEERLWMLVRRCQLGVRFRRQQGIGRYIVDFYCAKWKLVIELDGDSHFTPEAERYDLERDRFLGSVGLTVLRFSNQDVMQNIDGVLGQIVANGEVV